MSAVTAAGSPAWVWYLMRGSGAVSLVLLAASVFAGVAVTLRWSSRFATRLVVEGMHRNLSLLACCFLGVHVLTAVLDTFVSVSALDVVVPFRAGYQPLWMGLGTLVLDLLIALVVTSLLRDRIDRRVWRLVHWSAYACFPLALAHSIGSGTDSLQPWLLSIDVATAFAIGAVYSSRLSAGRQAETPAAGAYGGGDGSTWFPPPPPNPSSR